MIATTRARRSAAFIAVCVARTSSICSPQRITGLSAVIGSWKIIDIRVQRSSRSLASPAASRFSPSSRTTPPLARNSGGSNPITDWAITDFPEPDSPTRQTISPAATSKLTSSTAFGRSAPLGSAMDRSSTSSSAEAIFRSATSGADRACRAAHRQACSPPAPSVQGRFPDTGCCAERCGTAPGPRP